MIWTRCQAIVYVEETERELWERMTEHLRDIRLEMGNLHFGGECHTYRDVVFAALEKVYGAERTERKLREGL